MNTKRQAATVPYECLDDVILYRVKVYTTLDSADFYVCLADFFKDQYFQVATYRRWRRFAKTHPTDVFLHETKNNALLFYNEHPKPEQQSVKSVYIRFYDFASVLTRAMKTVYVEQV